MEKLFQANGPRKQANKGILVPDKMDFKPNQKRWERTLHTHQRENPPRYHFNS